MFVVVVIGSGQTHSARTQKRPACKLSLTKNPNQHQVTPYRVLNRTRGPAAAAAEAIAEMR